MNEAMINPEIVHWARERARLAPDDLAERMNKPREKLIEWETGQSRPTFRQAQKLADQLKVPFGYLFLKVPPRDSLPIPDLRTIGNFVSPDLSQNFRDLLNDILLKQEWFKEFQLENGQPRLEFVGRYSLRNTTEEVAADIARTLGITDSLQKKARDWESYLGLLVEKAEGAGILVMKSSIVGSNTHRPLAVEEFRGFAISDEYAPLVFINTADAPSARLFTLMHELTHLWLGASGVSNVPLGAAESATQQHREEVFCNKVAAELLVPGRAFLNDWQANNSLAENCHTLKKHYKVSSVVLARRALDLGLVIREDYLDFYQSELDRYKEKKSRSGGSFSLNLKARNGTLFSTAVAGAAMEGRLLLRDAARLLNISKASTLKNFAKDLNIG